MGAQHEEGNRIRQIALLAIGFGCLIGFSRMASLGFTGYLSQGIVESTDSWYALRAVTSLATFAALALNGLFKWIKMSTKALLASTAAAIAAAMVFAIDESNSLGGAVALLAGSSSAILMYVWMLLLSDRKMSDILCAAIIGLPVAGSIIMGVPRIDPALGMLVAALAAFGAGATALQLDPGLECCRPDGALGRSDAANVPWLTIIILLTCGIAVTMLYGIAEHLTWLYNWSPNYVALGIAAVATIAATVAIMTKDQNWMRHVWVPQFGLMIVALALSCISIRESIQLSVGLMLASVFCSHFFHWIAFPSLFSSLRIPRAFLAGVVLICANGSLAAMAGDAIGAALPHSMQNLGGVAGLMIIAIACIYAVAFSALRHLLGNAEKPGGATVAFESEIAMLDGGTAPAAGFGRITEGRVGDANAEKFSGKTSAGTAKTVGGTSDGTSDAAIADAPATPAAEESSLIATTPETPQSRMKRLSESHGLTRRETEVAALTAQGFSCAYIAEKLVVSNSTVRYHQQNLYRKFNIHSRNELIELATNANASAGSHMPAGAHGAPNAQANADAPGSDGTSRGQANVDTSDPNGAPGGRAKANVPSPADDESEDAREGEPTG